MPKFKCFGIFQIWNISKYAKFQIFRHISNLKYFKIFRNISKYLDFGIFRSISNLAYFDIFHLKIFWNIWNKFYSNSYIAAEVKICINYQSCSFESTLNASNHSHVTVRLESLKEKRQALPRLSQFGKTTLNESKSRDSHLTVLHAFRPVNKQQKVTSVDLALGQHYLYTSGSVTRLTIFNGCTSLKHF